MAKGVYRYVLQILVALGVLIGMTGCELAMNTAPPVNLSTPSTDLGLFVQQFAREALAAFLF